jgi:heme-degrading monooxygenase HmoA
VSRNLNVGGSSVIIFSGRRFANVFFFSATSSTMKPDRIALWAAKEGQMIARIWHGWTKPEHADAYQAMLKPELLPGLSKAKGFQGSYLLRRALGDEVEFVTMILWDSIEAIRAVAGANYEAAVIPEERRRYVHRFDAKAMHFEVLSEQKPSRNFRGRNG